MYINLTLQARPGPRKDQSTWLSVFLNMAQMLVAYFEPGVMGCDHVVPVWECGQLRAFTCSPNGAPILKKEIN